MRPTVLVVDARQRAGRGGARAPHARRRVDACHQSFVFDQRPTRIEFVLRVAAVEETITVASETPRADSREPSARPVAAPPSEKVLNLQKRAAGVLPIRIDVPRAGTAHHFVKARVVHQEATVTLRYKRR